jgi:hypothetical protein
VQREDYYKIVFDIYSRYWPQNTAQNIIHAESLRLSGNLSVVADEVSSGGTVVDLGGGWGAFSCACAAIGFRAILVDDCGDPGYGEQYNRRPELQRYCEADYGAAGSCPVVAV